MIQAHNPTPYHIKPSSYDNELLILCDETCVASVPLWENAGFGGTLNAQSYANARFIVRACNAHDGFVTTLKRALEAINAVPRFRAGATNSYAIASAIEAELKNAETWP